MKGISGDSIKNYCKEKNITVLELYKILFNGGEAKFDLTCNGIKAMFLKTRGNRFEISTRNDFFKTITFTT